MAENSFPAFRGNPAYDAEENLRNFINYAKTELSIFDWHENVWRFELNASRRTLHFRQLADNIQDHVPFESPYMDFAKAFVRYTHTLRASTASARHLNALRFLSAALRIVTGTQEVFRISGAVVLQAVALLDESGLQQAEKHHLARCLQQLFDFLRSQALICPALPDFDTRNFFRRPGNIARSTNAKGQKHRDERMPSMHTMKQVVNAFRLAETTEDRYWASVLMLLLFAPNRSGELQFLSINSLGWSDYTDKSGESSRKMFVRWYSEKGGGHLKKWVFGWFEEPVLQAFEILREISKPARDAAQFAYDNPGVYMIHELCLTPQEFPQDQVLSDEQFFTAARLGWPLKLLNKKGVLPPGRRKSLIPARLREFEDHNPTYSQLAANVLTNYRTSAWPKYHRLCKFPIWENLLLVRENEFDETKSVKLFSWGMPSRPALYTAMGTGGIAKKPSVFERLGLRDETGQPIAIQPHDIRRWHNTHAKQEGATELEIAWASGRKDLRQNRHYDLRQPEAIAERLHEVVQQGSSGIITRHHIPLHERVKMGLPVHRSDLITGEVGHNTVHLGPMGGCVRPVTEPDCLKSRQCYGCSKHVVVKGVPGCFEYFVEEERRLQKQWDRLQDRRHEPMMARTLMKIGTDLGFVRGRRRILQDANVPDGTVIQIPPEYDQSEVRIGLEEQGLEQPSRPSPEGVTADLALLLPELYGDA
ncbi:MAG: hypothetical protein EOM26_07680 [Alphaproteobacteria bacterium]|nr:hypothetical protein [Alphaproteobacteria bacterium]